MSAWWPAVYVGGLPTEWWLIGPDLELLERRAYVPGIAPEKERAR